MHYHLAFLHLRKVFFLPSNHRVHLLNHLVSDLLRLRLVVLAVVFGNELVLLRFLDEVDCVSSDVADRNLSFLSKLFDTLSELLTTVGCKHGHQQPNDFSVIAWRQAKVGLEDGLFDISEGRFIVRVNDDLLRVWSRDAREASKRGRGAVIVDLHAIQNCWVGTARGNGHEGVLKGDDALAHPLLRIQDLLVQVGSFAFGCSSGIDAQVTGGNGRVHACVDLSRRFFTKRRLPLLSAPLDESSGPHGRHNGGGNFGRFHLENLLA
mmetsp:Transcript_26300/g.49111  ORF Transcript_26300/g.49111 Transcript_26300/m.49111 type:complete len:265 (-) Transcript_26300:160-954(-)